MSAFLQVSGLDTGYGSKTILENINIEFYKNEFCALLGLNGSGKTTLIKTVLGQIPPKAGSCLVDNFDIHKLSEKKRARYIAYVPQRHSDLSGTTVMEVVLMGLNPYLGFFQFPSKKQKLLAEKTLDSLNMLPVISDNFSTLSEGQKQLIILCRCLLQDTDVMLMDEPDSALDFVNKHMILSTIRKLIHTQNKVGIVTLHDPNFALAYCDRLILLDNKKVVSQIDLRTSSQKDIEACLSLIYGKVSLIKHGNHYIMVSGGSFEKYVS